MSRLSIRAIRFFDDVAFRIDRAFPLVKVTFSVSWIESYPLSEFQLYYTTYSGTMTKLGYRAISRQTWRPWKLVTVGHKAQLDLKCNGTTHLRSRDSFETFAFSSHSSTLVKLKVMRMSRNIHFDTWKAQQYLKQLSIGKDLNDSSFQVCRAACKERKGSVLGDRCGCVSHS